jgi:S1-C subfamily serine protease
VQHSQHFGGRRVWTAVFLCLTAVSAVAFELGQQRGERQGGTPRAIAPRGALGADEQRTIDLFEQAKGSVVYISTSERVFDPWTRNVLSMPRGTGSGFIWDERGHIVTNVHVVAGAAEARVRLNDGRDAVATLVGASPGHDLAVLQVKVTGSGVARPMPIGTSHDLRVGQRVLAIGNPFGLDWTLTTGIISALDRSLPAEDGRSLLAHLIQIDAAINPGNSGGPLLDSAGRLIGVNAAIFSPSGASAGVGFAVPVDTVNRVVPQLIATGKYVRPGVGIEVDDGLNRLVTQRLGVKGVLVLKVTPGSNAATAGLQGVRFGRNGSVTPGDVIVSIDGTPIQTVAQLFARFDDHQVGDTVRLGLVRDGRPLEISVKLEPDDN